MKMKKIIIFILVTAFIPLSSYGDDLRVDYDGECYTHTSKENEWLATTFINIYNSETQCSGDCMYLEADEVTYGGCVAATEAPDPYWLNAITYIEYKYYNEVSAGLYNWQKKVTTYSVVCTTDAGYCYDTDLDGDGDPWCTDPDDNDPTSTETDIDGDGIENEEDLFPESDADFVWREEIYIYEDGVIIGVWYRAIDAETGEETWWYEGDEYDPADTKASIGEHGAWQDSSSYETIYGDGGTGTIGGDSGFVESYEDVGDSLIEAGEYSEGETLTSGSASDGTETDSELLQKIVNNTSYTTTNQQVLSDGITDLINKTESTNRYLDAIQENQLSSSQIKSAIAAGVEEGMEGVWEGQIDEQDEYYENEASGLTEVSADYTDLEDAYDTAIATITDDVTSEEIPDEYETEIDLETELEAIEDDSGIATAVSDLLEGSAVTTTGDCSFSYDYNGHTIYFTMCSFASFLTTFGVLMQSIVGIHCLLIIFRRR